MGENSDGEEEDRQSQEHGLDKQEEGSSNETCAETLESSIEDLNTLRRSQRNRKIPERYQDYTLLTYKEAITGNDKEKCLAAIKNEKDSLERNKTWTLVDSSSLNNVKRLNNRWVFTVKGNGKYKARLVVKGCEQRHGIDYMETFSPVISTSSLRILLALAADKDYMIMTLDIKTAFLYADLDEEIYMYPPEGFKYNNDNKLCKLNKALYGLKQAPIKWNQKFSNFLKRKELEPIQTEQCIYRRKETSLILAIYVDDGLIIGKDEEEIEDLIQKLKEEFEMTVTRQPEEFLGVEINKSKKKVKLTQTKYIKKILERFGLVQSKTVIHQ